MRHLLTALLVAGSFAAPLTQEQKPVPKDSVRVYIPGCSHDRIFTAYPPAEDRPGGTAVPEGTHLRMNGPKALMADIKRHEGSRIEITGLMKRSQTGPEGLRLGRGVRVMPGNGGPSAGLGGGMGSPVANQIQIDVEGWRQIPGDCPQR